ncbi:MAG: porin [Paraburkholderia sp.]|jgi:predicted porin
MNLKLALCFILIPFYETAHAQNSITLYGSIDAGVSYVSSSATATGHSSMVKFDDGVSQGNRWGLKGSEDLGGGLRAIFDLENGFTDGNGALAQGGALFGRQAWVGLTKQGVGSLTFGRQYSFSTDYLGNNYTLGSLTAAGQYAFHINDVDQLTSGRINNAVKFSSANFNGLTFGAMYGFSDQAGAFSGSPATDVDGVKSSGSSRAYSLGVNYRNGPFGVAVTYTDISYPSVATPAFTTNVANISTGGTKELSTLGAGARYAFGPALIFGNWTNTRFQPIIGAQSRLNIFEIGSKYALTSAFSASLGYTYSKLDDAYEGKWHQVTGVLDYALSKRTDVYVLAIYQKALGSNTIDGQNVPVQAEIGSSTSYLGTSGSGSTSQVAARIGIRHLF